MYILWSARMSGWFADTGNYTSDRKLAKQFTREEMIHICAKHHNNGFAEFGLLPIQLFILAEIKGAAK